MSDNWAESDVEAMRAALAEAETAAQQGEIPVGAIVVSAGDVIARGHNRSVGAHDPTGHAEIIALREACSQRKNHRLTDATLYVTLEPCAMCVGALVQARIRRLVFGAYDEKAGAAGSALDLTAERSFNHRYEVNGGLLQKECATLLKKFFAEKRTP